MRNSAARGALVQQPVSRLPVIDAWHHVLDHANRKDLLGGLGAAHTRGSNDAEEGAVRQQLNRVGRSQTCPFFLALRNRNVVGVQRLLDSGLFSTCQG